MEWPTSFGYKRLCYAYPTFSQDFAEFMENPLPFVIEAGSKHPAVFAYYGPDEPSEQHRAQCLEYSQIVAKLDPYRPNYFLFCSSMKDWPEVYDVAGRDYLLWRYQSPGQLGPESRERLHKCSS